MPNSVAAKRGNSQIDVHLPAGYEKVFNFSHVLAYHQSCGHRGDEIDPDDASIQQPVEICHAVALPFVFGFVKLYCCAEQFGGRFKSLGETEARSS